MQVGVEHPAAGLEFKRPRRGDMTKDPQPPAAAQHQASGSGADLSVLADLQRAAGAHRGAAHGVIRAAQCQRAAASHADPACTGDRAGEVATADRQAVGAEVELAGAEKAGDLLCRLQGDGAWRIDMERGGARQGSGDGGAQLSGADDGVALVAVGCGEDERGIAILREAASAYHRRGEGEIALRIEGSAAGADGDRAGRGDGRQNTQRAPVERHAPGCCPERRIGADRENPLQDRGPAAVGVRTGERKDACAGFRDLPDHGNGACVREVPRGIALGDDGCMHRIGRLTELEHGARARNGLVVGVAWFCDTILRSATTEPDAPIANRGGVGDEAPAGDPPARRPACDRHRVARVDRAGQRPGRRPFLGEVPKALIGAPAGTDCADLCDVEDIGWARSLARERQGPGRAASTAARNGSADEHSPGPQDQASLPPGG